MRYMKELYEQAIGLKLDDSDWTELVESLSVEDIEFLFEKLTLIG